MKKKICLYLALIMIINIIAPVVRPLPLQAAAQDKLKLNVPDEFNKYLAISAMGLTRPDLVTGVSGALPRDQAFMSWNLDSDLPFGNFNEGMYVLRYYRQDGKKVELTVRKYFDRMLLVNYDVYEYNTSSGMYVNVNDNAHAPFNQYTLNYGVHTPANPSRFVSIHQYFSPTNYNGAVDAGGVMLTDRVNNRDPYLSGNIYEDRNGSAYPSNDNDTVLTPQASDLLYRLSPSFNITAGNGYSFTYDHVEVSFYWDEVSNNFYVNTNGIAQGLIYDFKLEYYAKGTAYDPSRSFNTDPLHNNAAFFGYSYIFAGINIRTFTSIPYAENNKTLSRHLSGEEGYVNNPSPYDTSALQMPSTLTNGTIEKPGLPSNGLDIRFDIPKQFNQTTHLYDEIPSFALPVTLELYQADGANSIQVIVDDINTLPLTVAGTDNMLSASPPAARLNAIGETATLSDVSRLQNTTVAGPNDADRVRIKIDQLKPGIIFYSSRVAVTQPLNKPNFYTRGTELSAGYGQLYTFMDYDVVSIGGRLYISVTPYGMNTNEKILGFYRLMMGSPLQESEIYESAGDKPILFPITAGSQNLNMQRYQVQFSRTRQFTDTGTFFSQIIEYTPQSKAAAVGTPDAFKIMKDVDTSDGINKKYNLRSLPYATDGKSGDLIFWTQWDVGEVSQIKQLLSDAIDGKIEIDYTLYKSLAPTNNDRSYQVFDQITLSITEAVTTTTGALVVYSDGLSSPKITNTQEQSLKMRVDNTTIPPTTVYYADIEFTVRAAHNDTPLTQEPDFRYPNIYFMNVTPVEIRQRTISKPAGTGELLKSLPSSLYDYMTLDDLSKLAVPPPEKLRANALVVPVTLSDGTSAEKQAATIQYTIPGSGISKYLNSLYPYPHPEVTMNLYIGQNESLINDNFISAGKAMPLDERRDDKSDLAVAYTAVAGGSGNDLIISGEGYKDLRNVLRDSIASGTLCIKDIPIIKSNGVPVDPIADQALINSIISGNDWNVSLQLVGLDENQKYYFFADLVITQYDNNGNVLNYADGTPMVDASILTGLVGVTTSSDLNIPDPGEKTPSAPNLRVETDSVTQTQATINWDKIISDPGVANIEVEYEILRLRDKQMDGEQFDSLEPDFNLFINDIKDNKEKKAWATSDLDIDLVYDESGPKTHRVTASDPYVYNAEGSVIKLTDSSLLPNHLYFYYVRTVRTLAVYDAVNDRNYTKKIVSSWSRVTITTSPVQNPTNLKVETNRTDYDRKTEVIFSFDVPVFEFDKLGKDFNLQYQLKADNGDWAAPVNMSPSLLTDTANWAKSTDGKTIRFTYKLTGLKPNTVYSLRVCLYDINTDDSSLFSNTVEFKTNIDQQEYDDYIKTNEWMEFLEKLLKQLVKDPYWLARDTKSELSVVYRPGDYFNGLMGSSVGSSITLYGGSADSAVYYVPASALTDANNAGKGFRLVYDDLEVLLPPNMVSMNYNDAVINMASNLQNKTVSDYFMRVTVTRSRAYGLVEGNPALGKQTRINIELVGVKPAATNIKTWDENVYGRMTALLDAKINDSKIRTALQDQIKNETVSKDMVKYIEDLVADLKKDLHSEVYSELSTGSSGILSTYSANVTRFDAAMMLIANGLGENAYITGYHLQNAVWTPRAVVDFYNGKGMSVTAPGTFLFTGRNVNIPGVENVAGGGTFTTLTAKYGLDDYLGRESVNLNQYATRYMVAGCVARLAGAPQTADPIAWVSANLNLTLSSRSTSGNVQTQEAIAMVMALYEKKTNTKISAMAIRNYAVTANMAGLSERYTQAVRAAYETGIVTDTNLGPSSAVTIEKLLGMLAALDAKVKL